MNVFIPREDSEATPHPVNESSTLAICINNLFLASYRLFKRQSKLDIVNSRLVLLPGDA